MPKPIKFIFTGITLAEIKIYTCRECGSMVINREWHAKFHAEGSKTNKGYTVTNKEK